MAIYYLMVLSLQKYLVKNIKGVYGAWRIVPERVKEGHEEADEEAILDPYYSETLSKKAWFKNWNELNDLIDATCSDSAVGNFVMTSDVANFYDTIDIGRLTSSIRSDVEGESELVSLLDYFLRHWDRRIKGYLPSSKGIPQEIISDASRLLANYYLNDFDRTFKAYCDQKDIVYIRWADDIFIFGKSFKQLEEAMHKASRVLMGIGLNLSAAKTKKFTKKQFVNYRCIPLMNAVRQNNATKFVRELRRLDTFSKQNEVRLDLAMRLTLNMLHKNKKARQPYSLNFLSEKLNQYEYYSTLSDAQMIKKIEIFSKGKTKQFSEDLKRILSKPYAAPRAVFLLMIKKHKQKLISFGLTERKLNNAVDKIVSENADSSLIVDFCGPNARHAP